MKGLQKIFDGLLKGFCRRLKGVFTCVLHDFQQSLQGLSKLGLSADWAVQVISQVGNYEEVFERNLGMSTPLKIARGANQLYKDGGIFYVPPIK